MAVILYSTGCPKCNVLMKKLNEKGIAFEEFTDVDKMIEMDITSVPALSVNGELMDFTTAIAWINDNNESGGINEGCESCKLN